MMMIFISISIMIVIIFGGDFKQIVLFRTELPNTESPEHPVFTWGLGLRVEGLGFRV